MTRRVTMALLGVLAVAACDSGPDAPGFTTAGLRVVNGAAAGSIEIRVDGHLYATVPAASMTPVTLMDGGHSIEFRVVGSGVATTRTVTAVTGVARTLVLYDTTTGLASSILSDTGAVAPPGKSKLRVAHFAANAPALDIWRTQPDFQTPIRVQFPFPYQAVSPYLQSDVGDWRVMVSSAAAGVNPPMPDTLANSGPIAIGTAETLTIVVVDKPGGGVALVVAGP